MAPAVAPRGSGVVKPRLNKALRDNSGNADGYFGTGVGVLAWLARATGGLPPPQGGPQDGEEAALELAELVSARPSAVELLERPGALLTRGDLAALGLTRTMVDSVFRELCLVGAASLCSPAPGGRRFTSRTIWRWSSGRPIATTG